MSITISNVLSEKVRSRISITIPFQNNRRFNKNKIVKLGRINNEADTELGRINNELNKKLNEEVNGNFGRINNEQ